MNSTKIEKMIQTALRALPEEGLIRLDALLEFSPEVTEAQLRSIFDRYNVNLAAIAEQA